MSYRKPRTREVTTEAKQSQQTNSHFQNTQSKINLEKVCFPKLLPGTETSSTRSVLTAGRGCDVLQVFMTSRNII